MQRFDSLASQSRDAQITFKAINIYFVMQKHRPIFEQWEAGFGIGYSQRNICMERGNSTKRNSVRFYRLIRISNAGSIDQLYAKAIDINKSFDIIASSAGDWTHNAPLEIKK